MRIKCNLPMQIVLPGGAVLKPIRGDGENSEIINDAKAKGLKYRVVAVLARNLRGKLDLHHRPYQPNSYVFVEEKR